MINGKDEVAHSVSELLCEECHMSVQCTYTYVSRYTCKILVYM